MTMTDSQLTDAGQHMSSAEVCDLTGITYRQLDYWVRGGVLEPERSKHGRQGNPRMWTPDEVRIIHTLRRVNDLVITLTSVNRGASCATLRDCAAVLAIHTDAEWLLFEAGSVYACTAPPPTPSAGLLVEISRIHQGNGSRIHRSAAHMTMTDSQLTDAGQHEQDRAALVEGLRQFADFLADHPHIPAPTINVSMTHLVGPELCAAEWVDGLDTIELLPGAIDSYREIHRRFAGLTVAGWFYAETVAGTREVPVAPTTRTVEVPFTVEQIRARAEVVAP